MKRQLFILSFSFALGVLGCIPAGAQRYEAIPFGDFENWLSRNIHESAIIGGHDCTIYEIAPNGTVNGNSAYVPSGRSPWATSNVMAKVAGITKTSCAVEPAYRSPNNRYCRMDTRIERCKAVGIINIDVLVAGSIWLGRMFEPVTSTKSPYSKMEMGIPYTKRPKALVFDYMVEMPDVDERIYSSGFGGQVTYSGRDNAEAYILLQRRWEDADGNIFAKRVGTGREHFSTSTGGWKNGHRLVVNYGDITGESWYKPYMGLLNGKRAYYALNSHGKAVPVQEVGWDSPDATPTHMLVMFSSGSGVAYIGTPGLTLGVDNVKLEF